MQTLGQSMPQLTQSDFGSIAIKLPFLIDPEYLKTDLYYSFLSACFYTLESQKNCNPDFEFDLNLSHEVIWKK